jgi:hypothetical protein
MTFHTYRYSSVQRIGNGNWYSHIQTDDFKGAKDEAELDHLDHPEHAHGVRDNETQEIIFQVEE